MTSISPDSFDLSRPIWAEGQNIHASTEREANHRLIRRARQEATYAQAAAEKKTFNAAVANDRGTTEEKLGRQDHSKEEKAEASDGDQGYIARSTSPKTIRNE